MLITQNLHLIRKEFQVTPVVKRYVNIYLIVGKSGCYLIDSGVAGTEKLIEEYLLSMGESLTDIKGLLLTHAHPDHIGAANQIKRLSNCKVYAPAKELSWIEDIDNQFADRPIPNFYNLLSESVKVDVAVNDGMTLILDEDITIKCVETAGHSHGSMSYLLNDEVVFIGDAVPVVNDIPIFVDYNDTVSSINHLHSMERIQYYCPAWDEVYDSSSFDKITEASLRMLERLKNASKEVGQGNTEFILEKAELKQFAGNPLVAKSIEACCRA